ncbi:Tn3 family transposase [Halobacillus shinanisalinarum]|uniref:Tn3 family transposase n=1 Tax=Halobacillus shinanisalinarum TaxID=2932258 RepID=A0ABY4H108_9BACI|nr:MULTISPECIES: Tn3 family transposase [Halobacillus]UOQ93332.1 Tn3 family transposase [Halobacillus shinanisalinarum]
MRGKELLTPEQREEFLHPSKITEWDLATYYTFSNYDLEVINRHRRKHNRLGFAVQLCLLRYPGWSLSDIKEVSPLILSYIAKQLDIDPESFALYAQRGPTRREHLEEIRQEYGYKNFSLSEYRYLSRYLFHRAIENGNSVLLIRQSIEELRKRKIILPGMTTIERVVWEARNRAEQWIFNSINDGLSPKQEQQLDSLLEPTMDNGKTPLAWLKEYPGTSSPDTFLKVIERLEYIRKLDLKVNTHDIPPNRFRQLSRLGARYEPYAFRRFLSNKRYSVLVTYILDLSQDLIDQAIDIHDKQIVSLQNKGRKAQEEIQKQNGKTVNEKLIHFTNLGTALIKAKNENLDPFETIESIMSWEKVIQSVEEAKELSRPPNYDYLDLLEQRFFYLRKYTPTLLKSIEFRSTTAAKPIIKALDTINDMNETGKRKIPEGSPVDFVPKRWEKHVYDEDGAINRHYYEMAALTELKNHIRSGDISVVGSRQHKDIEDYFVTKQEWHTDCTKGIKLAVPISAGNYLTERETSLNQRLEWLSKNNKELDGINLDKGRLHIKRLEKDVPEEAREFSLSLYAMLPRIKLPDLLMEVSNWTNFDEQFIHASTGRIPDKEEKRILLATIMAMGTNIGLTKMAESTPDISYRQMANTSQWRMYEDAMNRAQAQLVNFHHKRALSSYWGTGTTSSSDGMRVQVGVSSLHAEANPHYGTGKGATIYRFTSDQFSTFYNKVINTNARDAVHVIDGLLHHESDLNIEEHYTDTAGYTDQIFGLTHLLGFRFAPRLRDISDSKLFSMNPPSDFPKLQTLIRGKVDRKVIHDNYDDVLRLAHSIQTGKVSGALIMGKLGSYARQNKVAKALREMGRIEKTIFLMDYIADASMRRRIQKGLNKGEAMNALARAIFFGKHGELREKALQDQLQRASALNIIINAICVWNTVYLEKAVTVLRQKGEMKEELLNHISPLGWEHINFLGEYRFESKNSTTVELLHPLNMK